MTPLYPARRRAERFADLVETADASRADVGVDAATAELLELVGALRSVPEAQPRPEFVNDLRTRLMTAAATELLPATAEPGRAVSDRLTVTPRHRPRERRLAAAVGALVIVGASTSMAVASQSALPGDALYPIKRVIENTHTTLSVGDEAKGTTLLHNAGDRLTEARDLSRDSDPDADRVSATLDTFTSQVQQGSELLMQDYRQHGNTASINRLRDFDSSSMVVLSSLDGLVPDGSQASLLDAAKQLFLVDAAAGQLCPDCTSTGITEFPATLVSSGSIQNPLADPTPLSLPGTGLPTDSIGGHQGGGGGQVVPTDPVSIAPSLLASALPTSLPSGVPTALPSSLPTTGVATPSSDVLSSVLGDLTGHHDDHSAQATPTSGLTLPSVDASALVSDAASAVGGVASDLASGVGTLVNGVVGGLAGNTGR